MTNDTAEKSPLEAPAILSRGKVVARFLTASILLLLLAQILNAALTTSAIQTATFNGYATAARIVGHDWGFRIQNALRFGKPLTEMFGLSDILAEIKTDLPFLSAVAVTLTDGTVIEKSASIDLPTDLSTTVATLMTPLLTEHFESIATVPVFSRQIAVDTVFIMAVPGREGAVAGAIVMIVPNAVIRGVANTGEKHALIWQAAITLSAVICLAFGSLFLVDSKKGFVRQKRLFFIPVAVLLVAQCLHAWLNIQNYRTIYIHTATANVERAVQRLSSDFSTLVAKGVDLHQVSGIEAPFSRMATDIPELGWLRLENVDGDPIASFNFEGQTDAGDTTVSAAVIHGRESGDSVTIAKLTSGLSSQAIAQGVRQRVLDAVTVAVTSALLVMELVLLLGIMMRRIGGSSVRALPTDNDEHHLLARPAAFTLLFGWGLGLSFVPLQMDRLIAAPFFGLSHNIALAIPTSVEMLCALFTTLAAGWLTEKRGWNVSFILGCLICAVGALGSGLASDGLAYVASRAVVGLGYGFAWMGIQGYIFTWSNPNKRSEAVANLVAGIFAGQICGNATGAMLANQNGFSAIFLLSAAFGLMPVLFAFVFMRRYFGIPAKQANTEAPIIEKGLVAAVPLSELTKDRDFISLLAFAVIPFSVAQVGLLYYTLPIYLNARGIEQSNIGRIMMIYGLSVIYLGPFLGRWVDRSRVKKPFVVLGGLIGGAGLAFVYLDPGIGSLVASVFLLGLASSLGGPAQSSFSLRLKSVQLVGVGRAMGVQRAADKFGQMAGPIALASVFAGFGTEGGLAVTGIFYFASTLLFFFISRERVPSVASKTDKI